MLLSLLFLHMKFSGKVYRLCERIPEGKVSSYKILAEKLDTKAYRAIGQALKRNPHAPTVPCHRIVSSSGSIGGFNGKISGEEIKKKIKLLENEGVKVKDNKVVDFERRLFRF